MMNKALLIGLLISATQMLVAQEIVATLFLQDTKVELVAHRSDKEGHVFFNMHDNENTGVEAAKKVIKKKGGVLYELVHSGERYIEFNYDTLHLKIDPNRIYTDTGVWHELERMTIQDSVVFKRDSAVFKLVKAFGDTLISLMAIDNQAVVLTLHNNTEGNYSMLSYIPGAEYEVDAEAAYNGKWKDSDEFYFVTTSRLYGMLTPTGFNVILQNNAKATDDGSLSVYCGQRSIEYVNIEAQHGHKRAQRKMVKKLLKAMQ